MRWQKKQARLIRANLMHKRDLRALLRGKLPLSGHGFDATTTASELAKRSFIR